MRIKSYFSGTVEAALQLASRELGDEALLLNARQSAEDVRHLGAYEVVVGVAEIPESAPRAESNLATYLMEQDVIPSLASKIASDFPAGVATDQEVRRSIARRLRLDTPAVGVGSVIGFVGPAGQGKTSTLLKVALRSAVPPVVIGCTRRVGDERLNRVAAIADLPFEPIDDLAVLPALVEAYRHDRPVLIDAPEREIRVPGIQTHLVLSAAVRSADLLLIAKRYQMFSPTHLILTRMDEASQAGGILSLAVETGLPISWLTSGPSMTDDLEDASLPRLLDLLFQNVRETRTMAAAGGSR